MVVVLGLSVAGVVRLRFATDILEVLPDDLPAVEALKVSQEHFKNDRQVILLLESANGQVEPEYAAELAGFLREKIAPAKVLHRSEFEEHPDVLAESLAAIWRYAPPEVVAKFEGRLLDREALAAHLSGVKESIRTSFDVEQTTMAAYDPLGFLQHPAIQSLMDGEAGFSSEDGRAHLLFISRDDIASGYREHAEWIAEIRKALSTWSGLKEYELTFRLTGGPVFNAEIGAGMERDMTGTIVLTTSLIGLLFLLVQRHLAQLAMIGLLLGITFLITLGVAGWVYESLNLVSVGFAAILLGLVIDYAVVIARESAGGRSSQELRRELAPAICWAAATTAVVFGLLMLSTFTGVRQLGGLIVIGLVTGTLVMLVAMPAFFRKFPVREPKQLLRAPFVRPTPSRWVIAACVAGSLATFAWKGAPEVSFNFSMVEPKSSEAAAAFKSIQQSFPAWSINQLQIIATADSMKALGDVANAADAAMKDLKAKGVLTSYQWPKDVIPNAVNAEVNQASIQRIAALREPLVTAMREQGFSDLGVSLDQKVLNAMANDAPEGYGALVETFLSQSSDGKYHLAGTVLTKQPVTVETLETLAPLIAKRHTVTGWPVLQATLLPLVKRDLFWIFLPAAGLLLVMLWFIFRSVRDAAAAIAVLVSALLLVNVWVSLTESSWNFLSVMAIPLIIGTGIDYCIHLVFALRRYNGDFHKVWNGVGKAICFCGLSTAIGFGSLLFASNETLRSMGMLCGLGVLLTTVLSVTVLPGLWQRCRH